MTSKFSDLRSLRAVRDQQAEPDHEAAPAAPPAPTPAAPLETPEGGNARRPGKRRDAAFTKATVYLNRKAYLEAKSRMMLAGRKGEVSDLLSELLIGYLDGRFAVDLPELPLEE